MTTRLEANQVERLQKRKRRSIVFLAAAVVLTALLCALRFIPPLNDRLSGTPQYAKAMTELAARELARASGNRSPVIVLGEDDHCNPLRQTGITEDQILASLYVLTWSEREHFTCMTDLVLPADPSQFKNLVTIRPGDGWTVGPRLAQPIQALPVMRTVHAFSVGYLHLLHWRAKPWTPITESQAARLAGRTYSSQSDASLRPDSTAGINLDFNEARALVREPHDRINSRLSLLLLGAALMLPVSATVLFRGYREVLRHEWQCQQVMSFRNFLFRNIYSIELAARNRSWAQQQELIRQRQAEESLRSERAEVEFALRSAIERLRDADLRRRIAECLGEGEPGMEALSRLWEEAKQELGQKTPEERLSLLLESLPPYCAEAEYESCRQEAMSIFRDSGFRAARKYVVATHDYFKLRAKKLEETESEDPPHER